MKPELVGEVVYRQFTRGAGRLRHTAWRGLREDWEPAGILAPRARERVAAGPAPAAPAPPPGKKITVQAGKRRLTLSNLDRPLYPDGFTKGEVIIHRISRQRHHTPAETRTTYYAQAHAA